MPGWADLIESYGVSEATGTRLVRSLRTCEAAALAFCRLLDGWARGEPQPSTVGRRQAALRRAAERAETALAGLEQPLERYLLELERDRRGTAVVRPTGPGRARGVGAGASPGRRRGRAAPGRAGLPRAGRSRTGARRAHHLRSLRVEARPCVTLGGLFDLRENLFGAADDLRALAA